MVKLQHKIKIAILGDIMSETNSNKLTIKKRGEDGTKIISVRIKEDILKQLDKIAQESNYSRNELINLILEYGIENLEII